MSERAPIQGVDHFPGHALYEMGAPEGTWTARLDRKAWGKSTNLILYFTDQATGGKHWISVWHLNKYNPRKGGLNFKSDAEPGELFELTTKTTKNGNTNLLTARKLGPTVAA
jgi:hypothetical protein